MANKQRSNFRTSLSQQPYFGHRKYINEALDSHFFDRFLQLKIQGICSFLALQVAGKCHGKIVLQMLHSLKFNQLRSNGL